jgi:transcriptional regulator with XRE-family HTH domain
MADETSVVPFAPPRMSESDYERERQRLRDLFGDSRSEAGTRWEQALAQLFWRSGWTQEELAAKEGKAQSYLSRMLCFGRFLAFSANMPTGHNLEITSERQFRKYWEQSEGSNERRRFLHVVEMIKAEERAGPTRARNALMDQVREHYSNGKWHGTDVIANRLGRDRDDVERVLAAATSRSAPSRYKIERRRRAQDYQYRIFPMANTVSTVELAEKLGPLVIKLKAEGRKNMATIAISLIALIADEMQQMLDEWTQ